MSPTTPPLDYLHSIDRYRFLTILQAAKECQEHQFAKQAETHWLVNYPGDLYVQYHQALTLRMLGNHKQAESAFKGLLERDPLFWEPAQALSDFAQSAEEEEEYRAQALYLKAVEGVDFQDGHWLKPLWKANQAFNQGDYDQAYDLVHQSLLRNPGSPLPAILHLKLAYEQNNQDMLSTLSDIYYQQWPKCLQINIIKAISEMNQGQDSHGVERLHYVAAHDSSGQVINRLMGSKHRFQDLWPDRMEIYFDLPVPASVSSYLGWNQLQSGQEPKPEFKGKEIPPKWQTTDPDEVTRQIRLGTGKAIERKDIEAIPSVIPQRETAKKEDLSSPSQLQMAQDLVKELTLEDLISDAETEEDLSLEDLEPKEEMVDDDTFATDKELEEIQKVFTKLAKKLKKTDLERADNRFPVYAVMSSRKQLETVYGPNTATTIDDLLKKLVTLVQKLPEWGAMLFYPDDPAQMAQYGLKPTIATDAWQVKTALADLDASLAKQGEMVGALLIVGGPEIVPYHRLPNPTQDSDLDVPSDNPYATIDENYFIPQWPVGRLPGETGPDAGLLLSQIRHVIYQYEKRAKAAKSGGVNLANVFSWVAALISNFGRNINSSKLKFGYSAEIWQEASRGVFKAVGNPNDLQLSPPVDTSSLILSNGHNHELGYFNLHGVKDGPHWYGQKDFTSPSNGPDYPIALSPTMFTDHRSSPKVVLTEACYGANVENKQNDEALSLKFLDSGTSTFIGSTCIAYGSVTMPLVAADFLAEKCWRQLLDGQPAGYALMQAKLNLAEEMTHLQGFLDGEDQKTILSFILLGDPLAVYDHLQAMPKPLFRIKSSPKVRTISDSDMVPTFDSSKMPKNVSKEVKKAVEKYLPGLDNAKMHISKSFAEKGTLEQENRNLTPNRYIVTLQKSFEQDQETTHQHFARMTFNKRGKLVKFTTSR